MNCPRCGGFCTIINETETTYGSYGLGKGCCGYIIFGWVGLLCGLLGMKPRSKSRSYWVCQNCGKKFKV